MIQGILETAIYVDDLDAAEKFYGGVLGLEMELKAENRHVFFRCGPGILLIFNADETLKPAAPDALPVPSHGTRGAGHVCFRVDAKQLDGMVEKLNKSGIPIESDFRWPNGARSIYLLDPAGNSLECAEPGLWNLE